MKNSLLDSDFELIRYLNRKTKKIISRETDKREYKESFNWNGMDKYAKSMASFANKSGGYLIFGISNNPRWLVGLKNESFEELDEKRITEYLNSYFSPEIFFEKYTLKTKRLKIGIIKVHKSEDGPILCIKSNSELKEADIYYRYNAISQRIKYPELQKIINQIRESERSNWMRYLGKMSQAGIENTAILNLDSGEITGKKQNLLIDEKLLPKLKFIKKGSFSKSGKPALKLIGNIKPVVVVSKDGDKKVRVTNDLNAPEVRIKEEDLKGLYPLNYSDLVKKLRKRYKYFTPNPYFHKIKNKIISEEQGVAFVRYLDPENNKSPRKVLYSQKILKSFDKYYKKEQ